MKTSYTLDTNGQRQTSGSLSVAFVRVPFWLRLVCRLSQRLIYLCPLIFTALMLLFSCPVASDSLRLHGLQHARPPCPSPSPRVRPTSRSLYHWCCSAISSSHTLFSFCPCSFPASGTIPTSHLFASDDQNTGVPASALVLPVNIQGRSPLRLTGLISLQSKGPSRVFSNTTVRRHQFFSVMPSLQSNFHTPTWPLGRSYPWLYGPLSAE